MKILHIINDLGSGGTEKNLISFVKNDKKNQHIICCSSNNKFYDTKGLKIFYTPKKFNYLYFFNNFFFIKKIIKREKPKILSLWMYRTCLISAFIKLFFRLKIVWNIRNGGDLNYFKLHNKIEYYLICLFSYIIPNLTIFNSHSSLKNHTKNGYSKSKNFVVQNGYVLNKKLAKISKSETFIICMIARFNYFKKHRLLIKSLSSIRKKIKFKLLLIGKNIDYKNKSLIELINKYQLENNTKLCGEVQDITRLLKTVDLHVLVSSNESFPNVVAESAYYSKISICSDVGDVRFILDNHFIFKNNINSIKKKIIYFYQLREKNFIKFNQLCNNQTKKIKKNYNLSKMINKFNIIYREI